MTNPITPAELAAWRALCERFRIWTGEDIDTAVRAITRLLAENKRLFEKIDDMSYELLELSERMASE